MHYFTIPPCEDLKDFISHFWVSRLNPDEQPGFIYYSTANTNTEMAFAFKSSADRDSALIFSSVQGHTNRSGQFPTARFTDMFGVSLYSYAVSCLFNVPASELTNQFVDMDTLLGTQGKYILEKMVNAGTTQDRIKILTGYFRSLLAKKHFEDHVIKKAIRQIRARNGMVNIRDLASECCLSQKQFERRFAAWSGINPKLYSRIIRFESALWNRRNYSSLTELAHSYGYYDQAHFIHEFKLFSGFSPNKFFLLSSY